jgi:2-C-methyl-D-erythritol 4-phosphate cytidylyltransferase
MVSAIIVAAGSSSRMGINKLAVEIGGIPVAVRSILAFESSPSVDEIIVVIREEDRALFEDWMKKYPSGKLKAFVKGGATRQQSVLSGISAASSGTDYYAIHDAARPFVAPPDIERVIADAKRYGAATLGVLTKDTIKAVSENGFIANTPDRSILYLTQTPQVFEKKQYLKAVDAALKMGLEFTDDCQLIENNGGRVYMTKGSYRNFKLTTGDDLLTAQAFAEGEKTV